MRNRFFLLCPFLIILFFHSCKKDKKNPPTKSDHYTTIDVQVMLPDGISLDLSKTKILSLSHTSGVGTDGKSNIPWSANTWEVAYLFDESKNMLMAGFISNESKEISITSTAQVMLYFGLGYAHTIADSQRMASIKKISSLSQFASFKAQLEQLFVNDPTMLSKDAYLENYVKTVNDITKVNVVDILGKQIKIEDADPTKSGITVKAQDGNDENVEMLNIYPRRGHAFFYKMGYRDQQNFPYTIIPEIINSIAPNEQLAVLGNNVSGPQALPLESHEKEATWKVRIVGVGGDETKSSSLSPTSQEAAKIEEMWVEFFAVDLLMPLLLDNLNQKTTAMELILPNNIDRVRAYINEVKAHVKSSTISKVKDGEYTQALGDFERSVLWDSHVLKTLSGKLLEGIKDLGSQQYVQSESDVEAILEYQQKVSEFSNKVVTGEEKQFSGEAEERLDVIDELFRIVHENCNTLEEWTVKSRDNDVDIKPRNSQVLKFTNHTLTVTANPSLSSGETVEYVWTTAGQFGVFKDGSQETTTVTTASKTVTYYGKTSPNEDNIEKVYVTAYIKSPSGTREFGSDTATINVKQVKIVMKPNGVTLTPKAGTKSLTLRLFNADGTNPITQGTGVQHKVEWSTPGNYGHLDGNVKTYTTPKNSVIYTATDEDVKSGTENITARVYFKLASTDWIFQEEVKGTVKISNDDKKIIYYAPLTSYHNDRDDGGGNLWHYTNCGVAIQPIQDALTYSVKITIPGVNPPTYSETWSASDPGWLHGYMYAIDPNTTGTYYVGYGASWGSCVNNGCVHNISDCSGTEAMITVTLK